MCTGVWHKIWLMYWWSHKHALAADCTTWRPLCSSHIIMFPVLTPRALFRLPFFPSYFRFKPSVIKLKESGNYLNAASMCCSSRGSPFVHVFTLFPHCPPLPPRAHHTLFWREYGILLKSWKPTKTWGLQKLWCNSNFISWALPPLVLFRPGHVVRALLGMHG